MFQALANKKINILVISTSEIKISVLIQSKNLKKSVELLHKEFSLNRWDTKNLEILKEKKQKK